MPNILSRVIGRLAKTLDAESEPAPRTQCESKQDYQTRFRMTLREWLLRHQQEIVFSKCSWMGVGTLKNPLDAWVYQEIIHEVKPDTIVEIGSYMGGATLYFAHLLDLMGNGTVVSVDIDRTRYEVEHDRIVTITGDSASQEVVDQVAGYCDGKNVLVFHDGDHSRAQVKKDLAAYSKFVNVGSYFIVEDGIVDLFEPEESLGLDTDGPLAAVEEFLTRHPEFVVDRDRERYILTYNPKGFLRRVG